MKPINKKIIDLEEDTITLVMDVKTYKKNKQTIKDIGFQNALYYLYRFIKDSNKLDTESFIRAIKWTEYDSHPATYTEDIFNLITKKEGNK